MNQRFYRFARAAALLGSFVAFVYTSTLTANSTPLPAVPPNIVTIAAKPMIMLNLSRDQELFVRAYNEYSDVDGDGVPDTTYKHTFKYYGYFDSNKCYTYASGMFSPDSVTNDRYCGGGQWSGNFLNWATMTKVDVLRKILYGGFRSTDTGSATVLERASLPADTHSFAKYYTGTDLEKLAPFSADQLAPIRTRDNDDVRRRLRYEASANGQWFYPSTVPAGAPANGSSCSALVAAVYGANNPPPAYNCVWFNTGSAFTTGVFSGSWFQVDVGDQMVVELQDEPGREMRGTVIQVGDPAVSNTQGRFGMVVPLEGFVGPDAATSYQKKWRFRNMSKQSVTMCNTTIGVPASGSSDTTWSYNNTNPPLMRVARGNHQLWNANERWQCHWNEEKSASNANNVAVTGLGASSGNPSRDSLGVKIGSEGPDFTVRVEACRSGLIGQERCKQYPSGNLKPIGLLHEYGETEQAEFGLFTGSWAKNVSGGVLRSNMKSFKTEVNTATDGTFTNAADIVTTLNKLRIYGYRYSDGTYQGDGNCTFQLIDDVTNNMCTDWGNPMGEMFVESLRYLAGKTASSDFDFTLSGSKDAQLGMPKPAWVDPFLRANETERAAVAAKFGPPHCRRINAVNFNSSMISFDEGMQTPLSTLGAGSLSALVNLIGTDEGIHGKSWFVGSNGSTDNRLCDAKTITSLSDVRGLCPDAPAYKGTFGVAGAMHWAWMNPIRTDIASYGAPDAFRVKSYNVALSLGKPRIAIKHPTSGKVIELQPSFLNAKSAAAYGSGTLIDFKVIAQTPTSGKYLVIWEDSQQGGDRDQDQAGILRWQIVGDELHVFTSNYVESTTTAQGFGYTISGSNKDGPHFHTGIEGFSYTDPVSPAVTRVTGTVDYRLNASGGCEGCQVGDPESRAVYTFAGQAAGVLNDPMWYGAKWGGFAKDGGAVKPSSVNSWDIKKLDGSAGSDGIPDNYFFAIRPDELERSLRTVFEDIIASSNTAPAVASAQLAEGSLKYVVRFDGNDGHGEINAYQINANGSFNTAPKWKAQERMAATLPGDRIIITNEGSTGIPLRWDNMSTATRSLAFGADSLAVSRLDWYRGGRSNEAPMGNNFRARNSLSVMGSIVNSNPHVQRKPGAPLFGEAFPGYGAFVTAQKNRKTLIWAGSNDGMLHAFDAGSGTSGGASVFSYLPQPMHGRLGAWINPGPVQALADGSPFTADVLRSVGGGSPTWATYLFSTLGRGGKGVFALDVTNTDTLSEANAPNIFKWQFTEADDNSGDLGYIVEQDNTPSRFTGQPMSVAKMNNGKYAVMFGNGVESANGSAALYIFFVNGPGGGAWSRTGTSASYIKLVVPTAAGGNGLAQPLWVDTDSDMIADAIYAGDLKGNLWKFDVKSSNPTEWKVALEGRPLFKAQSTDGNAATFQPVTSAPEFAFHPKGGLVVAFGTGKAYSNVDFPDASGRPHSVYGIWDKPTYASMTASELDASLPRLRSTLQSRTLTRADNGDGYVTGDAIDWSTKLGWYFNLPVSSEMVISNVLVTPLKLLGVVSISPVIGSTSCSSAPNAYVTFIDPITGLLPQNVLGLMEVDVNGSVKKVNIASKKLASGDQMVTIARDRTNKASVTGLTGETARNNCIRVVGDKTDLTLCSQGQDRRIQWREIFNFRTR